MARDIIVTGARQHNLKNITVRIPGNRLVVLTGPSGSGKSSLAFDTLYAEGQRRYVEALSVAARQALEQLERPDVDSIEGLCPAIAIEQRSWQANPRSTVATVSELYDFLRLLFARIGSPHCPECGHEVRAHSVAQAVAELRGLPEGTRIQVLSPVVRHEKGDHRKTIAELIQAGFVRVRVDGQMFDLAAVPALAKNQLHTLELVVDRLVLRPGVEGRLADSVQLAYRQSGGIARIEVVSPEPQPKGEWTFTEGAFCPDCERSLPELSPSLFSFNSPAGACPQCKGLGSTLHLDAERIVDHPDRPLGDGAIRAWKLLGSAKFRAGLLEALGRKYGFPPEATWQEIPPEAQRAILFGTPDPLRIAIARAGKTQRFSMRFDGLIAWLERRLAKSEDILLHETLRPYLGHRPCASCGGARLRPEALAVKIHGLSIAELSRRTVGDVLTFFRQLPLSPRQATLAARVLEEMVSRLRFLCELGLDYLTLDRPADSLSGGEAQRLRLASQIGSGLSGVLYVLDEPSIGLHPRDHGRLLRMLFELRDRGNTIVVVEHDRQTILAADYVIDMGPGAGDRGGQVVAAGSPQEILANPNSLTGQYLSGRKSIPLPDRRRTGNGWSLDLRGATVHNLKEVDVAIPLGTFTCVSGVSGAGKSSLVIETLYKALAQRLHGSKAPAGPFRELTGWQFLDKVVIVDQNPFGRTPRSNAATYTGLFTPLREWFASLPEARTRGYSAGRFSFNVKGGRCEACKGEGVVRISMHFLPDVYVTCDVCGGSRYDPQTLEVRYKGRSIADVLRLSVQEALELFSQIPALHQKLLTLQQIGLGYLPLGQPATTLSGGEIQRLKLAKELSRRATGRTLYILDEPTTGLHFEDIGRLLEVLQRLVDAGNTVLVVEHNLEVIANADYVIDLGPEGGQAGGRVVAAGTPEVVAETPGSHTGLYLRPLLSRTPTDSAAGAPAQGPA